MVLTLTRCQTGRHTPPPFIFGRSLCCMRARVDTDMEKSHSACRVLAPILFRNKDQFMDGTNVEGLGVGNSLPDLRIVVAATFTANAIEVPLKFWLDTMKLGATITMAPYAQVLQEL